MRCRSKGKKSGWMKDDTVPLNSFMLCLKMFMRSAPEFYFNIKLNFIVISTASVISTHLKSRSSIGLADL